jgi:outer membrane protein assembly factor BamE
MHGIIQKILIYAVLVSTVLLGGCGITGWPPVHRIDVNQGNVVNQEMVDQLRPGMNKAQVNFVMGSPMLADPFHQDRWDYVFWVRQGRSKPQVKQVSLLFRDDRLAQISGDYRPRPQGELAPTRPEKTLAVPLQKGSKGVFRQLLETFGIGRD